MHHLQTRTSTGSAPPFVRQPVSILRHSGSKGKTSRSSGEGLKARVTADLDARHAASDLCFTGDGPDDQSGSWWRLK